MAAGPSQSISSAALFKLSQNVRPIFLSECSFFLEKCSLSTKLIKYVLKTISHQVTDKQITSSSGNLVRRLLLPPQGGTRSLIYVMSR